MNTYRLSKVRVVIADSTDISSQTTRTILHNMGVRDIAVTRDVPSTQDALAKSAFDLLVLNSHLGDEETADLIHKVRHGDLGKDPFVPIIALSWEPSIDVVSRLVNAGADVLLTLPLSADKVTTTLEGMIERRKPFVVTSNYIGPDRRRSIRAGMPNIQLTVVPNSLRRKATGIDTVADHAAVAQAIFEQRIERYISRITFTVGKITGLTSGEDEGTFSGWVADLKIAAYNLSKRIGETRYASHAPLSETLIDLAGAMSAHETPAQEDLDLLQQIALALEIAIKDDDTVIIEAMLDVEKAVNDLEPSA